MGDVYIREAHGEAARSVRGEHERPTTYGPSEQGMGLLGFAGVMLGIVAALNFIYGIAAISNSHFYTRHTSYIISSLSAWGWVILIVGAVQVLAAVSILTQTGWGRWVGLATASVNAIVQLLFIPSYPFAALAIFGVDIVIVYALATYGGRRATA